MDSLYRFMRMILFFDLPVVTAKQRKTYRHFVKDLVECGFYRIQESVFVKLAINKSSVDATMAHLKDKKPSEGNVVVLIITERQFASMEMLVGEMATDVVDSDERYVEL